MRRVARVFLYFQVLALALFGLWFLAQPNAAGAAVGLSAVGVAGLSEFRSFYFATFVSWAALMAYGLRVDPRALGVVALTMLLVVLGRLVSVAVDGVSPTALGAAAMELLIGVACRVAMAQPVASEARS